MTLPLLIASDVDGTLLDDDENVTPRTRAPCSPPRSEAGTQFVLATGRPPRWVQPVVDALGFAPMAVCANGAVIYDPATDRIVSARTLSTDVLGELAEIATRVIPGAGLAVERVGRSAHDAATPQFVSSPGYEHAWLNPDNTEVSRRGPAQRAGDQAAHPQGGCAQCRHGRRARRTRWAARRYHLLDQQRPDRDRAAGHQQGHRRRRGGATATRSPPRTWWRSVTCPTTCRCCGGPGSVWRWAMPIRRRSTAADEVTAPTPTTGWPACSSAGGCSDASSAADRSV